MGATDAHFEWRGKCYRFLPTPRKQPCTTGVITWAFTYWSPPPHALYHTPSNPLPCLMKQVLTPTLQMGKVIIQKPRADPVIWSSDITHFGDHLVSKRRQNMNLKLTQDFGKGRVQEVALKSKLHRKSVSGKSQTVAELGVWPGYKACAVCFRKAETDPGSELSPIPHPLPRHPPAAH